MLPALATVDDLATWLGVPIEGTPDLPRAQAILSAASTLVRSHTGRVWVGADGEVEEGTDPLRFDAVQQVVVLVAQRVWTNPNGSTQETTGPFSRSVEAWSALGLALRDDEKAMLGGTTGGIPGLGTISFTRGDLETPAVYECPDGVYVWGSDT